MQSTEKAQDQMWHATDGPNLENLQYSQTRKNLNYLGRTTLGSN